MDMTCRMRRLHSRDRRSKRETADLTWLSQNTVVTGLPVTR